jgi:hypothetical protein
MVYKDADGQIRSRLLFKTKRDADLFQKREIHLPDPRQHAETKSDNPDDWAQGFIAQAEGYAADSLKYNLTVFTRARGKDLKWKYSDDSIKFLKALSRNLKPQELAGALLASRADIGSEAASVKVFRDTIQEICDAGALKELVQIVAKYAKTKKTGSALSKEQLDGLYKVFKRK